MQARTDFSSTRIASAVVAVVALAASASSFAGGNMTASADAAAQTEAALAVSSTYLKANAGGPLTREQVREELRQARASGTLSMNGEAGDTPQVLAAREAFNTAQSETIVAEVIADQQRVVALAAAEIRRSEIEAEGELARSLALSEGETVVPEGSAAADTPEVQVDVIDMQTSAAPSAPNELVIVSLDGGDAAAQRDRAMHVRRQLGAMGLSQSQIYIESAGAEAEGEAVAAAEGDVEVSAVEADGN